MTKKDDNNMKRVDLLKTMILIRKLEDAWGEAYLNDEIGGIPPSLSTGQEAVSTGACAALEDGDFVFTTHRGQAPQIARGLEPKKIMAELYCKRPGYNKGKSYHVTDVTKGVIGMGGIVPAQVPVAGGMALSQKMQGTDRVSLAFFGDGASNEGAFHETANLAAMWTLPLILLCENNGYCITQPVTDAIKAPSIAIRAEGYGIPGITVDGNDPVAVRDAVAEAVARARKGEGATLIEAVTNRLAGHLAHDNQGYRPEGELEAGWEKCPIKILSAQLIAEGVITFEEFDTMQSNAEDIKTKAVEFARQSPYPETGEAYEDLWA